METKRERALNASEGWDSESEHFAHANSNEPNTNSE